MIRLIFFPWLLIIAIPVWVTFIIPAWLTGRLRLAGRARWDVIKFHVILKESWNPWFKLWEYFVGRTLPFAILIRPDHEHPIIMAHELRHSDQWLILGPLFPLLYYALHLIFDGHERNPLEIDAHKYGGDTRYPRA